MADNFTTETAATYLGVSRARVRKLIKDGRLPAEKRGRDHIIQESDLENFIRHGRKNRGRPPENGCARAIIMEDPPMYHSSHFHSATVGNGEIITGDSLEVLPKLGDRKFQLIIADPPYFQVLLEESWDNKWKSSDDS